VLAKRIKLRVRSIKEHGWALCVKVGSLEGVICRMVETQKRVVQEAEEVEGISWRRSPVVE
jgi:hypothetical protein